MDKSPVYFQLSVFHKYISLVKSTFVILAILRLNRLTVFWRNNSSNLICLPYSWVVHSFIHSLTPFTHSLTHSEFVNSVISQLVKKKTQNLIRFQIKLKTIVLSKRTSGILWNKKASCILWNKKVKLQGWYYNLKWGQTCSSGGTARRSVYDMWIRRINGKHAGMRWNSRQTK